MQAGRHSRFRLWGFSLALGMVSAAAAWAALARFSADSRERDYVIAKGTWARRMAGENVETLPSEIHLTLGVQDILVIRNEDDVPRMIGPVFLMPGQKFQFPFRSATRVQFACTLHTSGQLFIVVEPTPARGWERLVWRIESVLNSAAENTSIENNRSV